MRSHPVCRWLLVVMLLLLTPPLQAADGGRGLPLSSQQDAWLREHPTIVVGLYDKGWPPFESLEQGRPQGLAYEYLKDAAARLGLQIRPRRFASWADLLQAACAGEIDVMMNLSLTAERTRCVVFTRPYVEAPVALVGRLNDASCWSGRDCSAATTAGSR
jgi:two-component system, NarL family, sensor histidine kinase EvgS